MELAFGYGFEDSLALFDYDLELHMFGAAAFDESGDLLPQIRREITQTYVHFLSAALLGR